MLRAFTRYSLFISVLLLQACIKDKPVEPQKANVTINPGNTVFVVNEGGFGHNEASVSLYDPASNSVATDYYGQQNNNQVLGDVCQSMLKYNGHYYLVVNNSHKIVVVSATDFKNQAVITGFNSPRYILPVTYNKAYVSDLYSNSLQVVDLNTNAVTASIPCAGATEEMALIYNKAFVTNPSSNYTYVVNTIANHIDDSVQVGPGAASLAFDKNDKLWVLASGTGTTSAGARLSRIDPVTLQVEASFYFNTGHSPWRLCFNKTKDTLYYLNNGVYQMPVTSSQLPTQPLVSQGTMNFYGLGVNPNDYHIYVSDAVDYSQKSAIMVYDANGSLKKSFHAGIISNGFVFE